MTVYALDVFVLFSPNISYFMAKFMSVKGGFLCYAGNSIMSTPTELDAWGIDYISPRTLPLPRHRVHGSLPTWLPLCYSFWPTQSSSIQKS